MVRNSQKESDAGDSNYGDIIDLHDCRFAAWSVYRLTVRFVARQFLRVDDRDIYWGVDILSRICRINDTSYFKGDRARNRRMR